MNVQITDKEIGDLIAGKYIVSPVFKTVDAKTVEVSYKPAGFFPNICVRFHIEAMRRDIVCMTYDCAPATALIIGGNSVLTNPSGFFSDDLYRDTRDALERDCYVIVEKIQKLLI